MLITNIYNMADTFFVGKINTGASGAVGIVFGFMSILQAVGFMFGQGAGSIISRALGNMDKGRANTVASTAFFSAFFIGIVFLILGLPFIEPLVYMLGSTDTILPYAKAYISYILLAAPFMVSSFVMNQILRYEGKAALSMIGLSIGGLLNIIVDPILMFGLNMGISGAGLSTAVSQFISFMILLSFFLTGKSQSKISIKLCSKKLSDLVQIISTGFPSLIRQGLSCISIMILNRCAGVYGDSAIAAMTIVNRVCFFAFAVGLGIGQGYQPVAGFNYGAKKYSRVKKGFFFTWYASTVLMGVFAVIGMIMAPEIVKILRDDADVISIGTFALRLQLAMVIIQPFAVCSNMMFQSTGKNKQAAVTAMFRSGLFFIPVIIIFSRCFGITGIQIAQPAADLITFCAVIPFTIRYLKDLPSDNEQPVHISV